MKKISLIVLLVQLYSFAAGDAESKARELLDFRNAETFFGRVSENQTYCIMRNGLYFVHGGKNYVAEVTAYRCRWESKEEPGIEGFTTCLKFSGVHRYQMLCDCSLKGELNCFK